VSHDAIQRDKPLDKSGDKPRGQEDSTSEPLGQELVFSARVSLDQTQMLVDDREVNLSPGMAVTVEIKTGSRRMIEYLLSPLLKYRQESLRDR
jgi:hemolysin D